jgi:hypothetical protein
MDVFDETKGEKHLNSIFEKIWGPRRPPDLANYFPNLFQVLYMKNLEKFKI